MKTTHTFDPVRLLVAVNPVPPERLATLDEAPERERTLALIRARRAEPARPKRAGLRRAALGLAALAALAVPSLALSGQLGSLFGFSNQGASVDESKLDLHTASALGTAGARGTVKLLASRAGIGIYVAHGANGQLCYFVGPPNGPDQRGLSGGCLNAAASAKFPSPEEPVIDMSAFFYKPYTIGEQISRLAGVAADGVAQIQVLGLDCDVIAEAPVVDNVYASTDVPAKPAVGIAGVDANGKRVFLFKLRFWDRSACTTG